MAGQIHADFLLALIELESDLTLDGWRARSTRMKAAVIGKDAEGLVIHNRALARQPPPRAPSDLLRHT
jgi:hypothetical protein